MSLRARESQVSSRRRRLRLALNIVLAGAGVLAVAALVLEYGGFQDLPRWFRHALRVVEVLILAVFVLDRVLRAVIAPQPRQYVRRNWVDFALIGVLLVAMVVISRLTDKLLSAGALYVAITQVYILLALILHGLSANLRLAGSGIHPTWMLIGSFALMCLAGSGLLMLPAAQNPESALKLARNMEAALSPPCPG